MSKWLAFFLRPAVRLRAATVMRALAVLVLLWLVSPAQAADIYVASNFFGWPTIHIDGFIDVGDEQKFARIASQYPAGTAVEPDSPGGVVGPALEIGSLIWRRGFDTLLTVKDNGCASACAFIWLSGRHAIVQRNSLLCFHQPYDPKTHQTYPEINRLVASYLQSVGLTETQAWKLVNAAPPEGARCATEWWAMELGFQPQIVFTMGARRACQSKFCLAMP